MCAFADFGRLEMVQRRVLVRNEMFEVPVFLQFRPNFDDEKLPAFALFEILHVEEVDGVQTAFLLFANDEAVVEKAEIFRHFVF